MYFIKEIFYDVKNDRGTTVLDIYEQFGNVENGSLAGIYSDIADVIGIDGAYAIFRHFKGLQVCFPSRFLNNEFTIQCMHREYDGTNIKALAQKYDYTESRVRQLLKSN